MRDDVLISQIKSYLSRTNTSISALGRKALSDPRFISEVFEGRRIGYMVRLKITECMRNHPEGLRTGYKPRVIPPRVRDPEYMQSPLTDDEYYDSTPCPKCGINPKIGCSHRQYNYESLRLIWNRFSLSPF